jgi:hypothetical protein
MKRISFIFAAAVCFSTTTIAQNNQSLNLKKGQKYIVENKIVTTSSTEMQGQTMEANADVTSTYSIEVKEVTGDTYNLSNTLTAIKMNMSQMGQEMSFDSDKKEDADGPIGSTLKDYINQPQTVVVDKSGKVIPQKKEDSTEETNMMIRQLGDFEATGYGANMAFESLPKNIKVGSTWSNTTDDNGIAKTTNYKVTAINGNIATIALSGTVSSDIKMENQGMEISTKTTGKFTGEEKVDVKSGIIQSNSTTIDASGIIGVMGQELPTSSKITSTSTIKAI